MTRRYFVLRSASIRANACQAVREADDGWIVEVRQPTRNLSQNAALWAMLTDVSEQVEWYGQRLSPDDWKHVFTAALHQERVVPGINGGFVVLGQRTSRMTIGEMSDLLEVIQAFGADRGVQFNAHETVAS